MTTFEKCDIIRRALLTRVGEVMCYRKWSDAYCTSNIRETPEQFQKRYEYLRDIQPCELSAEECDRLGFGRWSKDSPIRLIPIWLFPFLADEVRTICIDGSEVMKRSEMDDDHRAGFLAYGITPRDAVTEAVQ